MEKTQYQLVKNFITHKLQNWLQLHWDDNTLSKFIYMFWTGVEATTKDGKTTELYPVGHILGWLIETLTQQKSPYEKIDGDVNPITKIRFTGKHLTHLLNQAKHNSHAWDAAKKLAVEIKKQGDELPKDLEAFVINTLTSTGPKDARGPHPMKKLHRDCCIVMLMSELERIGFLPATKNSSFSNTLSLCDAIVEALTDLQKPLSYDGVKSIWDKREEIEKLLPAFRLDFSEKGSIYIGYSIKRA